MAPSVIVCNGCCCGNLEKGHDKVPFELLENEWEMHELNENIPLKFSGCLGPCSMRNVVILDTVEGPIWLGVTVVGGGCMEAKRWRCRSN